jgi:NitT/TauT family transport system permease protein
MSEGTAVPGSLAGRRRPGAERATRSIRRWLLPVAAPIAAILLWQLASGTVIDPFLLPAPTTVAAGLGELAANGTLQESVAISLFRILSGWLVGSALAIPIGLLVGTSLTARQVIDPFVHFFRFVPAIALITLFIMWLGVREESKVGLIAYATGFIVLVNTASGVGAIPPDKVDAARCLGAGRWQVFAHVIAPASVPFVFTGMRIAMATAFVVIVGAEIIAANSGLGYLVWTSRLYFRIDWVFAGVIVIGVLGFLTDRAWGWIGRHLFGRYLRQSSGY